MHDGPGTRTTVFLGGCGFACAWCCNPEGLARRPQILHREARCVACGHCLEACPRGAISLGPGGQPVFQRGTCAQCESLDCVAACYHEGLVQSGRYYTVAELERVFQRDRQFWGRGGGVTFSGGEPLLQEEFMRTLLRRCRELKLHTCVETTAGLASPWFLEAAGLLDWLFVDIKHMDPVVHQRLTGSDNAQTLENLRLLGQSDLDCFVVVRVPVLAGVNDGEANLRATARYVRECGLEVINLLPFHRLGESKWKQLGRLYPFREMPSMEPGELEPAAGWIRDEGLSCYVGWETPF